jgi:hypothetical protein
MYEKHAPLLRSLHDLGIPAPRRLQVAAEMALRIQLLHAIQAPEFEVEPIDRLVQKAVQTGVDLKEPGDLGFALAKSIERLTRHARAQFDDLDRLQRWLDVVHLARSLPFPTRLWQVQNIYYDMGLVVLPIVRQQAQQGDERAQRWLDLFGQLGDALAVRMPVEAAVSGTVAAT